MSETNGGGERARDPSIAHKPGLDDIVARQQAVLRALAAPFPDENAVLAWKGDVALAAVGRLSDGARALLSDLDLAPILSVYYTRKDAPGDEFRVVMRELLAVEFARAVEDMSRLSAEERERAGIAGGSFRTPFPEAASFR